MLGFSDRLTDLSVRLEYSLVYVAVGVSILFAVPVLDALPIPLSLFFVAVSALGTLVYVRYGFLVVRENCPTCGGAIGLGAVWCPTHHGVQSRFTHLGLQFVLLVALTYVVGAAIGLSFTVLSIVQPFGGSLFDAVAGPGYGFFRTSVGLYGMLAAVPVPVAIGSLLRAVSGATDLA